MGRHLAAPGSGNLNLTRQHKPGASKPQSRCSCRACIADSLERALDRLARPDLPTAARIIMIAIEDLRERAPIREPRRHPEGRP